MKRSTDGGRTWGDRLPPPENWATSQEVPTIFRVVNGAGGRRLLVFSGLFPIRVARSEDDGHTWTPLEPIGDLVADPAVEVVMHAPSADLTLLGLALDVRPAALIDVQLTAGFVGLGAGQGLATLLDRVLSVRLDKGERYTDWAKRPLRAEIGSSCK